MEELKDELFSPVARGVAAAGISNVAEPTDDGCVYIAAPWGAGLADRELAALQRALAAAAFSPRAWACSGGDAAMPSVGLRYAGPTCTHSACDIVEFSNIQLWRR